MTLSKFSSFSSCANAYISEIYSLDYPAAENDRVRSMLVREVEGRTDNSKGSHSDAMSIEAIGSRYKVDTATSQVTKQSIFVMKPPLSPPRAQVNYSVFFRTKVLLV